MVSKDRPCSVPPRDHTLGQAGLTPAPVPHLRRGSSNPYLVASAWQERLHFDGLPWSREGRLHEASHEGIDQRSGDPTPPFHLIEDLCPPPAAQRGRCQGAALPNRWAEKRAAWHLTSLGQMLGDRRTVFPEASHPTPLISLGPP